MENVVVKVPFSSVAEILALVMTELVIILKDLFSSLRYVLQLSLHFLSSHLHEVRTEFDTCVDDDQNQLKVMTKCCDKVVQTNRDNLPKKLCIEEVKDVMHRLVENNLCDEEFFEEEVSLEEVREAFYVFDENKDGFIDAGEVQRVLCALGYTEASLKECKAMIKAFDKDGDGRIDFKEFVKIMEDSFL